MDLFVLYTYQAQSHGSDGVAPTEECHAYLFLSQADAQNAVSQVQTALTNGFTVAGSFGYMILPLEQVS